MIASLSVKFNQRLIGQQSNRKESRNFVQEILWAIQLEGKKIQFYKSLVSKVLIFYSGDQGLKIHPQ
jgi:hypothetical protein